MSASFGDHQALFFHSKVQAMIDDLQDCHYLHHKELIPFLEDLRKVAYAVSLAEDGDCGPNRSLDEMENFFKKYSNSENSPLSTNLKDLVYIEFDEEVLDDQDFLTTAIDPIDYYDKCSAVVLRKEKKILYDGPEDLLRLIKNRYKLHEYESIIYNPGGIGGIF